MKINYFELNPPAVEAILAAKKHSTAIEKGLRALVEIRVSQINGCAFCVDLHTTEARQLGVDQQLLDCLVVWRESELFSEREVAALEWAENITHIASEKNIEEKQAEVLKQFTEAEVVDLTLIVSVMNNLNRLAIGLGDKPSSQSA
ncbi:MAG: carboxymuconolactone decarboxylase family protein [Pseudomonadota bacterium]